VLAYYAIPSYTGNQLSPTIEERSLMLLLCEQTDELEVSDNDVLGNLRRLSDPTNVILHIIQDALISVRWETKLLLVMIATIYCSKN